MTFKIPEAKKENLEKLLEYLGNTDLYSEIYDGNRAEDFKKCFDVDSEWCWKYAAIVLRGIEQRELAYAEMHHIIPKSFYGCDAKSLSGRAGNMTVLSYAEHVYAHFCAYKCAREKSIQSLRNAFAFMYYRTASAPVDVAEAELIADIFSKEIDVVKREMPAAKTLDEQGRHHLWEVSLPEYSKEYYEQNKGRILARVKEYADSHKTERAEYLTEYRSLHRDELLVKKREYAATHKGEILERSRRYTEENHDVILANRRVRYQDNREKLLAEKKEYFANNREAILERNKNHYAEKIAAGFRRRKDPATGKTCWIFVGNPTAAEAA